MLPALNLSPLSLEGVRQHTTQKVRNAFQMQSHLDMNKRQRTTKQPVSLVLPPEILLKVARHTSPRDRLALRQTNRAFWELTHTMVWSHMMIDMSGLTPATPLSPRMAAAGYQDGSIDGFLGSSGSQYKHKLSNRGIGSGGLSTWGEQDRSANGVLVTRRNLRAACTAIVQQGFAQTLPHVRTISVWVPYGLDIEEPRLDQNDTTMTDIMYASELALVEWLMKRMVNQDSRRRYVNIATSSQFMSQSKGTMLCSLLEMSQGLGQSLDLTVECARQDDVGHAQRPIVPLPAVPINHVRPLDIVQLDGGGLQQRMEILRRERPAAAATTTARERELGQRSVFENFGAGLDRVRIQVGCAHCARLDIQSLTRGPIPTNVEQLAIVNSGSASEHVFETSQLDAFLTNNRLHTLTFQGMLLRNGVTHHTNEDAGDGPVWILPEIEILNLDASFCFLHSVDFFDTHRLKTLRITNRLSHVLKAMDLPNLTRLSVKETKPYSKDSLLQFPWSFDQAPNLRQLELERMCLYSIVSMLNTHDLFNLRSLIIHNVVPSKSLDLNGVTMGDDSTQIARLVQSPGTAHLQVIVLDAYALDNVARGLGRANDYWRQLQHVYLTNPLIEDYDEVRLRWVSDEAIHDTVSLVNVNNAYKYYT